MQEIEMIRSYRNKTLGSSGDTLENSGDTLENSGDTLGDTLDSKIIVMLNENANLTQMELAEAFHVSVLTIKRAMKRLLDSGQIVRKGGKRFGYWEVL